MTASIYILYILERDRLNFVFGRRNCRFVSFGPFSFLAKTKIPFSEVRNFHFCVLYTLSLTNYIVVFISVFYTLYRWQIILLYSWKKGNWCETNILDFSRIKKNCSAICLLQILKSAFSFVFCRNWQSNFVFDYRRNQNVSFGSGFVSAENEKHSFGRSLTNTSKMLSCVHFQVQYILYTSIYTVQSVQYALYTSIDMNLWSFEDQWLDTHKGKM